MAAIVISFLTTMRITDVKLMELTSFPLHRLGARDAIPGFFPFEARVPSPGKTFLSNPLRKQEQAGKSGLHMLSGNLRNFLS